MFSTDPQGLRDATVYYKLVHLGQTHQKRMILLSDKYPRRMQQVLFPNSYNACRFFNFAVDKFIPYAVCCTYEEFVRLAASMNREVLQMGGPRRYY